MANRNGLRPSKRSRNPADRICHYCRGLMGADVVRVPMAECPGGSWLAHRECGARAVGVKHPATPYAEKGVK